MIRSIVIFYIFEKTTFVKTKLFLSLLFFFYPILLFGQADYPPCSAFDTTGKDTLRALNSFGNFLYAGIDNPLSINRKCVPFKKLIVECNRGMAMEDEENYDIIPSKPGETTISIYQFDSIDTVPVIKKLFIVKPVPQPYVTLDLQKLNKYEFITRDKLRNTNKFEIHLSDDFIDDSEWFSIKEIIFGYPIGKVYITKSCKGPRLSEEILKCIKSLPNGTEVSFGFTIAGSGDLFKRIAPIRLKVY
jgi:hypothetical protein